MNQLITMYTQRRRWDSSPWVMPMTCFMLRFVTIYPSYCINLVPKPRTIFHNKDIKNIFINWVTCVYTCQFWTRFWWNSILRFHKTSKFWVKNCEFLLKIPARSKIRGWPLQFINFLTTSISLPFRLLPIHPHPFHRRLALRSSMTWFALTRKNKFSLKLTRYNFFWAKNNLGQVKHSSTIKRRIHPELRNTSWSSVTRY